MNDEDDDPTVERRTALLPRRSDTVWGRFVEHILGAFVSTLMIGFLGWLGGFIEMRRDVLEQGKSLIEMKKDMSVIQRDMGELKMQGFRADTELDKRVTRLEDRSEK